MPNIPAKRTFQAPSASWNQQLGPYLCTRDDFNIGVTVYVEESDFARIEPRSDLAAKATEIKQYNIYSIATKKDHHSIHFGPGFAARSSEQEGKGRGHGRGTYMRYAGRGVKRVVPKDTSLTFSFLCGTETEKLSSLALKEGKKSVGAITASLSR